MSFQVSYSTNPCYNQPLVTFQLPPLSLQSQELLQRQHTQLSYQLQQIQFQMSQQLQRQQLQLQLQSLACVYHPFQQLPVQQMPMSFHAPTVSNTLPSSFPHQENPSSTSQNMTTMRKRTSPVPKRPHIRHHSVYNDYTMDQLQRFKNGQPNSVQSLLHYYRIRSHHPNDDDTYPVRYIYVCKYCDHIYSTGHITRHLIHKHKDQYFPDELANRAV